MIDGINLPLILGAAFLASASPGPATLTIAGTSMASGRRAGLALASGVTTGSLIWSIAAAFGLGAIMLANTWAFETIRYAGAAYLMWLAFKSARSAWYGTKLQAPELTRTTPARAYAKGLALHLTNPKAVLFFGALYSIGVPPGTGVSALITVIVAIGIQSFVMFHLYALIFSSAPMTAAYTRMKRGFETAFALAFGAGSLSILTARLG
ncbi:Threonine efflux protein [Ascidiaceihabitans donghaensis]|uniref:Threonine efflux protein n=1 Tax=Ascidiaceihabitans donghaensis TaxID=1510460 RepID=A0A2R8BAE6_9RHOB|nr:LysE family transporter [Ascidiaceihabitans donghaensis]SPH20042.1 Threonine efflux protein [Ascidiaceihabitans donghaensis]